MHESAAAGSTRVTLDFEPEIATIWLTLPVHPMPCITPALIEDFNAVAESLRREHGRETPSDEQPFKFLVVRSAGERVFSLGGDLTSLAETIKAGRTDVLDQSARGGAEASFNLADGFGCCFVTISLVRGRALGGGFETARSCHLMAAERGAFFQLPEASVGLFPANGISTLIAPRIGYRLARRLVLEGIKIDASDALDLGVLDELYEPGLGAAGIRTLIARLTPTHGAQIAFEKGMLRQQNVSFDTLAAETAFWAKTISRLPPSSLERMQRVGVLQRRMFGNERRTATKARPVAGDGPA